MADINPFEEFAPIAAPDAPPVAADDNPFAEFAPPIPSADLSAPEVTDTATESLPAVSASVPGPAEPGLLDKAWDIVSNPLDSLNSVGESAQVAIESALSPLGVQAPVAAAEAAPNYLYGKAKDLLSGTDTSPSFGSYMDMARKDINARAEKYSTTNTIGRFAGDTAAGLATGGFGTAALGAQAVKYGGAIAEAAPVIARATSTAAKLLGPTLTMGAKAAVGLAAEGAVQGAEQAAATVVDQQIARGDFKGLAGKLYSELGPGAWEGMKWNTIIGGATRLGLHGLSRGKTGKVEELSFKNAASETPDVADVYDPNLPLRSSDIVDAGTPEAIAARQLTTPEVAKDVQLDALPDIEKDFKRMFAIEDNHAKSVVHSAENAFDDVDVSNGVETDLQSKNVYHERLPLRGSELVDNATPDVVAARKAITPEQHKIQVDRAVKDVIKLENESQELGERLDHVLRKHAKIQDAKTYDQPHTGDSFDTILEKNGLSVEYLKKLEKDTKGDGGNIARVRRAIETQRGNLANGGAPAAVVGGPVLQAPGIGSRVATVGVPSSFEGATDLVNSLKKASARARRTSGPTQGEIFNALDQVKSVVQKTAAQAKGGLVHEALLDPGKNLRLYLENPDYVPENLARGQQAVNAKWSPDIQLQRNVDHLYQDGTINAEFVGGDEYHIVPVMKEETAKSVFSKLGSMDANEQIEENFRAAGRQRADAFSERLRWVKGDDKSAADVRRLMEIQFQKEQTLNKIVLLNRYAEQAANTPAVDPAYTSLRIGDRVKTQGISGISGILSQIGSEVGDATEEGLKSTMRRKEASLAAGPAKDEYRALRIKVENQLNRVGLANKYAAETAKNPPPVGILPGVVGAIAGAGAASTFGPLGASVGAGAGAVAAKKSADLLQAWKVRNNADSAKAALQIKSAVVKAQARMDKASRLQGLLEKVANPVQRTGQAVELEVVKKRVEDELKKIDERQENGDKTLSQINKLIDHGGEELGQAYAEHLNARDAFLLEKAGLAPRTSVFGTEDRELDEDTAETMARYLDAVDNPVAAIERMASGEATVEDQESLAALNPELVSEFRTSVMDQLATSKKKLSYDEKETLASILGVGLTNDSDPDSIAFFQGLSSAPEEEQPKGSSKTYKGQDVASRGDSLLT